MVGGPPFGPLVSYLLASRLNGVMPVVTGLAMSAHLPPAVSLPVSPGGVVRWLGLGIWLLGAVGVLALVVALHQSGEPMPRWLVPGLLAWLLFNTGWLWRHWRTGWVRGWLIWQSGGWRIAAELTEEGVDGRPEVVMDWQTRMLLRFHPLPARPAPRWIWATAKASPQSWHDFRCALYSSPRPDSGANQNMPGTAA